MPQSFSYDLASINWPHHKKFQRFKNLFFWLSREVRAFLKAVFNDEDAYERD